MSSNSNQTGALWDSLFQNQVDVYGTEPNDFVRLGAGLLKPGSRILSLGEGEGRNALHLLRLGHHVTCVDVSAIARERALKSFARENFSADYLLMDLSETLPVGKWDAVVSVGCHLPPILRREVHARLSGWLSDGGIYLAEGYTPDQLRFGTGGPTDLELLYDPPQIRQEIPLRLEIFQKAERFISEGPRHQGMSATLQIIGRNTQLLNRESKIEAQQPG